MSIDGKITEIYDPVTTNDGKYTKQTFVVKPSGKYAKPIAFILWNEKIKELDGLDVGKNVVVSFDVRSRQWQDRWFTEAIAWKVQPQIKDAADLFDKQEKAPPPGEDDIPPKDHVTSLNEQSGDTEEETDDLPF